MYKILNTILIALLAATAALQAQSLNLTFYAYPAFNGPSVSLENGMPAMTLGGAENSGYLAIFWWSADGVTYDALGMAGFNDLMPDYPGNDGGFVFSSPTVVPRAGDEWNGTTSYIGVSVFRYDPGVAAGWGADEWNQFILDHAVGALGDANSQALADLWNDAKTGAFGGGEISDPDPGSSWWGGQLTHGEGGMVSEIDIVGGPGGLNWGSDVQYLGRPDLVPEPSTWLLLGGAAAFATIFRRRKGEPMD